MTQINYYGCTRDEYNDCRELIDNSNASCCWSASFYSMLFLGILSFISFFYQPLSIFRFVYMIFFVLITIVFALMAKKILPVRLNVYIVMTLLYGLSFVLSVVLTDMRSTMITMFVILMPAMLIDHYFRIVIFNAIFCIAYSISMLYIKSGSVQFYEIYATFYAFVISSVAHYVIQTKVLKGFVSMNRLKIGSQQDSLTGLKNRQTFEKEVNTIISARRPCDIQILGILDLDDFKQINDNYGHQTGDDFLIEVASRMKKIITAPDCIGRIGGDEFMFFMSSGDTAEMQRKISAVLEAINEITVDKSMHFSASIGITKHLGELTFNELYRQADKALYDAKGQGKNTICRYGE